MHKTPELSQMAKVLAEELGERGVQLKHTQAMSMVARMLGARTLQVAQAHSEYSAGVRARAVALAQASRLMFASLGRFENGYDVIAAIRAGFALADEHGSRAVETAMAQLFERADSPVVSEAFAPYRLDELPQLFETMVERLAATLRPDAPAAPGQVETLYCGEMLDWRVSEGTKPGELPEGHRGRFEVKVQRHGQQFLLEIARAHVRPEDIEGTDQLSLWVEINEGRPCVHLTNEVYGDMLLSVFATRDGLVLRPDEGEPILARSPRDTALAEFVAEQYGASARHREAQQLRFVVHKTCDEN